MQHAREVAAGGIRPAITSRDLQHFAHLDLAPGRVRATRGDLERRPAIRRDDDRVAATTSLASAKGPSDTVIFPPRDSMRAPGGDFARPAHSTYFSRASARRSTSPSRGTSRRRDRREVLASRNNSMKRGPSSGGTRRDRHREVQLDELGARGGTTLGDLERLGLCARRT